MDTNNLPQFVLILTLVGLIIGVGVLTMDKFGSAVYTDVVHPTGENLSLWTHNYTAVTFPTVTTSTATAVNSSGDAHNIVFDSSGKWKGTSLKLSDTSDSGNGTYFNVSYTYGADSKTTDALQSSRDEVSNVSTVWLGLIVTIAILAIILGLVIGSFAKSFGRR